MIKLDLFFIWRLYRQIWISGTNNDVNMNIEFLELMTAINYDSFMDLHT
jgi:hypothetical protein